MLSENDKLLINSKLNKGVLSKTDLVDLNKAQQEGILFEFFKVSKSDIKKKYGNEIKRVRSILLRQKNNKIKFKVEKEVKKKTPVVKEKKELSGVVCEFCGSFMKDVGSNGVGRDYECLKCHAKTSIMR